MSPSPRSRPSPARASRAPTARSPRRALFRVPGITYLSHVRGRVHARCEDGLASSASCPSRTPRRARSTPSTTCSLRHTLPHRALGARQGRPQPARASPGTRLEDVHEVWSHEQALAQCAGYLAGLGVRHAHVPEHRPGRRARGAKRARGRGRALVARLRRPLRPRHPRGRRAGLRRQLHAVRRHLRRARASIPGRRAPRSCSPCRTSPARSTGCWSASTPSTSTS